MSDQEVLEKLATIPVALLHVKKGVDNRVTGTWSWENPDDPERGVRFQADWHGLTVGTTLTLEHARTVLTPKPDGETKFFGISVARQGDWYCQ